MRKGAHGLSLRLASVSYNVGNRGKRGGGGGGVGRTLVVDPAASELGEPLAISTSWGVLCPKASESDDLLVASRGELTETAR